MTLPILLCSCAITYQKNTTKKSDLLLSHNCTLFVAVVTSVFPERGGKKTRKHKIEEIKVTRYSQAITNKYTQSH